MEINRQLSTVERQEEIWRLVQAKQRASVAEICDQFSISEATARRDLEALADQKRVQRVHGGAIITRQATPEPPVMQRSSEQSDEKERIAEAAARLVGDGETIFLGGGTTVLKVAHQLRGHRNLTVITNSLLVINELANLPNVTVVSLGGVLRHSEHTFIGHITEQALQGLHPQKVIIGIRAIDLEHGLTNDYLPETMTDRAILGIGREVIIVADHTKCSYVSTSLVAPITAIHTLVTDTGTAPEFIEALTAEGVRVLAV